jgi:acid-sensing ion channel, other
LDDPLPWNISHTQLALYFQFFQTKYESIFHFQYDDSNYFQPFGDYRIIIHNNDEFPSYSGSQLFEMKHTYQDVRILPELNLIDEKVKAMSVRRRQCYLPQEKQLKYFKVYTKKNCEQECLAELMMKTCSCVPFYVISKSSNHLLSADFKKCR